MSTLAIVAVAVIAFLVGIAAMIGLLVYGVNKYLDDSQPEGPEGGHLSSFHLARLSPEMRKRYLATRLG